MSLFPCTCVKDTIKSLHYKKKQHSSLGLAPFLPQKEEIRCLNYSKNGLKLNFLDLKVPVMEGVWKIQYVRTTWISRNIDSAILQLEL